MSPAHSSLGECGGRERQEANSTWWKHAPGGVDHKDGVASFSNAAQCAHHFTVYKALGVPFPPFIHTTSSMRDFFFFNL